MGPALYVGHLRHRRFRPLPHAFTYSLFMALVDVDDPARAMRASRFTSYNRFNWACFDERDHLGDPTVPLRERVRRSASDHGIRLPDGPVRLLTHLRYLGYAFNPISFYFCFDPGETLRFIMAEVNSTFGEQQVYWMPVADGAMTTRHQTPKLMHVSPFNPMCLDYDFTVTPPGARFVAHMNTIDRSEATDRPFFDATLTLEHRPWNAAELRRVLLRHPFMTAKVIAAIHWEALRLWWKGLRYYPKVTQESK